MKPETILALSYPCKNADIKARLAEWIGAYKAIAEEHPSAEDMAEILISKAERACAYLCGTSNEPVFGGEFPLGNERDASFASHYFSVYDMAKIQLGYAASVSPSLYLPVFDQSELIRKGFLFELAEEWKNAEKSYLSALETITEALEIRRVTERSEYCKKQAEIKGNELYEKGMALVTELDFDGAWYPLYEAAELEHTEAMAEVGYMLAHDLGVRADVEEALRFLRKSADMGSDYACYVLWEMHDDGFRDVSAEEAKKYCEAAAKRGSKKAIARMEDGFDLRSEIEILSEQAERGSIDALWYLSREYAALGDADKFAEYLYKAADAGQTDALLYLAQAHADPSEEELYDMAKAEEYYRKAADKGSEKAILALGEMALTDTDAPFWRQAAENTDTEENIKKQHSTQFAWYLLAAEGGCTDAMTHVAIAYHYGYPCEKNAENAFLWASRAADGGDAYAAYQTGYFYENGYGCGKDMEAAVLLYTKAAEAGIFEAMLRLDEIYRYGKDGIAPDIQKANRYRFLSGIGRD